MENIRYKLELLLNSHKIVTGKKYLFNHIILFGYVMIQLKKKIKNRKQVIANKKWQHKHKDLYNEMKRKTSKNYYHSNENYRLKKQNNYYFKKECTRLLNIQL
jgi:hypothetical protein